MTRYITIITAFIWVLDSFAQEFGTHWISYPIPNDSSEVLFCQTYTTKGKPQQALLSFSSCGFLKVFVNERNITQDITFCNRESHIICIQTYDVTHFLRPDSNTIAVWYAPIKGTTTSKQLSLEFYGKDNCGKVFFHKTDGDWKCQKLESCYLKDNKENFNALQYNNGWKATDYKRDTWVSPLGTYNFSSDYITSCSPSDHKNYRLSNILTPLYTYTDSIGLHCDFGREFTGTIRVTLRETRTGEILHTNNLIYVCKGEIDEQLFHHFSVHRNRIITIQGDKYFQNNQVTNIEALEYE